MYVCSNPHMASLNIAEICLTSIMSNSVALTTTFSSKCVSRSIDELACRRFGSVVVVWPPSDDSASDSLTPSAFLVARIPATSTKMLSFVTLKPSIERFDIWYTKPSLTPSTGGIGIDGRTRRMKSRAVSVASDRSFCLAASSLIAFPALSKSSLTSIFSIPSMTLSFVIPAFSAICRASSTILLPETPSIASSTCSPCLTRFSPAATTLSSLRILTTSSMTAFTVISPEMIFRTCFKTSSIVSSVKDSSAASSCFSISTAARFAIGSNNFAVPPSPLARTAISSGVICSPKCDSNSHRTCSNFSSTTSRYSFRCERIEIRDSLASLLAESAWPWRSVSISFN
mmetsp:Transcript_20929/g.51430  ORF Transcript_20929/g.51430 Transcript_20929/m.51430 type:complete len:343 (-) Transcript_20929:1463-2491(-)